MDIDMDIKELEAFVYVVENCSFSRAAELLHLTQPTISSHVSALERKLNIKLIVRTTKETYPSDAGKLLYKYAKEILQVRENAAIALRNFSQEMKGTISIAASTVPSQYYLPHLLQDFRARYPDITFNIQMEDSPKVVELVATRSVEIGFCGTMVASHKCVYQDFASDPMVLITPNTEKYQAFAGKPFPIEQLKEETFISREKGSGTYQAGKELLNELRYVAKEKLHLLFNSKTQLIPLHKGFCFLGWRYKIIKKKIIKRIDNSKRKSRINTILDIKTPEQYLSVKQYLSRGNTWLFQKHYLQQRRLNYGYN